MKCKKCGVDIDVVRGSCMGCGFSDNTEKILEVVAAWAVLGRELNISLVGLMDLPEKRAMGRMCMAVSALRECVAYKADDSRDIDAEIDAAIASGIQPGPSNGSFDYYAAMARALSEQAQVVMRAEGAE